VRFTPTCPVCRRQDAEPHKSRWICGAPCWTVFTGSQLEWERTRDLREHHEAQERWRAAREETE
jgi:hypothetical protein